MENETTEEQPWMTDWSYTYAKKNLDESAKALPKAQKALVAAALVCRGTRDCMDPRNEGSSRELLETMADAIDDLDVEEFLP